MINLPVLSIALPITTDHHVGLAFLLHGQKPFQKIMLYPIICINKGDPVSFRPDHSQIPGCGNTSIRFLMENTYPLLFIGELLTKLQTIIF